MRKGDIEKSLKRFLKRKVSYSLSLLIAFMITGGISFAEGITTEDIQATKSDLLTKIQVEREEIKRKLAENERLIREYDSEFVDLVKKGDFYSKPSFNSTQIFLTYEYLDSGKMKNRTIEEFSETITAINKHYGYTKTGRASKLKLTGNPGVDKLLDGNGVAVDDEVFREEIEVGANIKPIQPELPLVNPSISVSASAPTVILGALPGTVTPTVASIPSVTAPTITAPAAPGGVSVTVTTPSAVDKITVTAPTVTTPTTPGDKNIVVNAPATPAGFEPTTVTAPTAPSIPVVVPPTIPSFASVVASSGNGTLNAHDKRDLSNGVIEMVSIKSGDFKLNRNTSSTWTYQYTGYSGINSWGDTTAYHSTGATYDGRSESDHHPDVALGGTWNNLSRTSTTSSGGQLGFQKLVGSAQQSTMLSNAKFLYTRGMENSGSNLGEFVHLDIHGAAPVASQRTGLVTGTAGLTNQAAILAAYDDAGNNINWSGRTTSAGNRYTWINSGKIVIEGGNTSVTNNYDHHGVSSAKAIVINTGDIIFQPYFNGTNYYQKFTSAFVMSLDGTGVHHIMYNGTTGTIKTYTQTASLFLSGSSGANRPLSIVNRGKLEMYGQNSAGIYLKTNSMNDLFFVNDGFTFNAATNTATGTYNPIKLFGDSSIGLYGAATAGSTIGNLAVDIGAAGVGNQLFTTTEGTAGTALTGHNVNPTNGTNMNIQGSFGIIANAAINLTSHQIRIYDKTEKNVGVYPNADVALNIGGGVMSLDGGTGNIAILIDGKGSVTSTGNITLNGGTGNMAIYVKGGSGGIAETATVKKVTAANTTDSVVIYGESGAKINVDEVNVISQVGANPTTINKKDTGAAFATGANTVITMNRAAVPGTANITITGKKLDDADRYVGFGVMATAGGTVNAKNNYIKVVNGSTAAASIGTNSKIDLTGATVEFDGSGYAVYSDGVGTIDLSSAKLVLKGKATAFDVDMALGTPPIKLDASSRINVNSNDVVVFNLKNAVGLNTTGLEASITGALGTGLGVNLSNLIVAGAGIDKYKIAAVDGGTITVGDLDKTGVGAGGESTAQTDGNFYYNRFLGQRLKATATGSTISAVLNNTLAAKYNNQVVGLEMNSSKLAVLNSETGIYLVGSTIIADRDGAGSGAIGAFINYGEVTLDAASKIKVEKEANAANSQAVGVYSVNGSRVDNGGEILVGGNQSIGILGMAYREDSSNTPVVNEFGGAAAGQGKINITNSSKITLDGTGTVGIYAYNNNTSATKADSVVTNTATGVITVGDSTASNAAIGIYGEKATISNLGTISVGDGGVAIYAKKGTEVTNLGTLDLGADGVGVMLDGTSDISATTMTVTSNNSGTLGKTAVYYKGTGGENKSVNVAINATALDKGTAVYAEDMNITSSGTLGMGKDGIGIFVKGGAGNTGTNLGTINLTAGKTGAVGMYTKTSTLLNNTAGTINVNDTTQVGIYAEGANAKIVNKGTVNLNADGTTGIYVKSGAKTELDLGNNIVFNGKESVGVYAEGASISLKENLTFAENNQDKNIFIYGKAAAVEIAAGKTLTVNGMTAPTTHGNKSVGIYLENNGTASTFTSNTTGQVVVSNEAVGIYSKGNNTLAVNVTAAGDKTTGVFIDGASTITGTVTAKGTPTAGAVGVYGSGGVVTIGAGGLNLVTDTARGTGMYLTDGATAAGGTITVNNTAAGTKNIGVYYSKGTASGTKTSSAAINLIGSESIGLYAADGITLVNNGNITSAAGKIDNIGAYVGGGSQLTSAGNITMNDDDSIGMYVEEGKGINSGTITLNGTATVPAKSVVGMVAEANAGKTAAAENTGTITAGANLGMYVGGAGASSGKNSGSITTTTGTGVYVDGATNSFNGTGGTITSNKVGMYLKNTGAGKITAGTLNIASGGVGVFGDNAKIDFAVNVTGAEAVGVAARNNTVISGNITTGNDSVGVYVLNNTVSFAGSTITTGTNLSPGKSSIGILLDSAVGTYTMSNVTVNAKDGVGIYLDGTTPGINLTHNGTVNTVGGIGIYVDNGTTLTTGTTVLNINGGTGVYVDGGTANLGTTGNLKFNFLAGGGIGVFNNGGTMNLGANITVSGSGSLAATTNGSLSSAGNLNINEGATGLMGLYDAGMTAAHSVNNSGTINAALGGIGLAAVKGTTTPTFPVTINNTGTINASGVSSGNTPSIGIYTDVANVVSSGTINVGNQGIGIYANHNGVLTSVSNTKMNMTGTGGIGVYIKGATNGIAANNINSTTAGNTGVVLEGTAGTLNIGTVSLGNESVGALVTGTAASTINGTITVGNSSGTKSGIGIVAQNGANMTLAGTTKIKAGTGGIGVYASGAGTTVTVPNVSNITVGANGIYLYSQNATLNFTGNIVADNQIGIVADGGAINSGGSAITAKNGGIGIYVKGAAPAFGATTVTVQAGTAGKYSMGIYYDGITGAITAPTISQTGSYTIGMVLNNSTATTTGGISIGGASDSNQVGVMAKGNSNLTVAGNVGVTGSENIGVYGENSRVTVLGGVSVGNSVKDKSSLGVSLSGGSYTGNGNISVGNYSIGIFGKNMTAGSNITQGSGTQTMNVGNSGLGIYGEGTGGTVTANMAGITVGKTNAIGVYAKGMNASVTGNMSIGAASSVGIVSEGNGNVSYTGAMTIADKGAEAASVGIYKTKGNGTITTSAGSWAVGDGGYGIYVQQDNSGKSAVINNNADMLLGTTSVGIFSNGANTVVNSGTVTVGKTNVNGQHSDATKHENSVGIYASGGTLVTNTAAGIIKVHEDHSVGVYVQGTGTRFANFGTVDIDKGGVGIIVRDNAIAVNEIGGTIILGSNGSSACSGYNIGMSASGPGAAIENHGTITINSGVGMVVENGASLKNTGILNVNNGVGISGNGTVVNTGTMNVAPGAEGHSTSGGLATANVGAVTITPDGVIKINEKYVSIGGTLTTSGAIVVNGAYVDVTTNTPLFNASSVTGEVRILPNFALTGNGISYEIDGFIGTAMGTITGTKLTAVTSPLFIAKITNSGSLVIAKRPYADLTIGEQFDAMDKGLDNILKNSGGNGKDAEILKGLNSYLEGLDAADFERETSQKLAEFRGDIYATIQGRMQDINRAFANSFYELESSYNLTKDSSKYSVLYTDGKYRDDTLGIDDYDYKVIGLLFMKEKEGAEYGTKYGYTLGFAGSKFDFDDGGSKEDVYSIRAGVHRVKRLSDTHKLSWLTRLDLGYNRHIAKRKLNLQETYENKGEFNTYSVSLDNRLIKNMYSSLSTDLDIYGILDLEYGKIQDFTESGNLEVKLKENDYFSAQVGAGVKASHKIYTHNDIIVKASADAKYLYELGENYDRNKAKLKNGQEGYYSLIKPEEREGKVVGTVGLTIEKANHMGVTFEVSASDESHKSDTNIRYGVKFNYKF